MGDLIAISGGERKNIANVLDLYNGRSPRPEEVTQKKDNMPGIEVVLEEKGSTNCHYFQTPTPGILRKAFYSYFGCR